MHDVLFGGISGGVSKSAVGAFGAGLITTYDSELDFRRSEWRLWPDGAPDRTGFTRLKSNIRAEGRGASKIFLDAVVGGYAGEFGLDTGAPGEMSLSSRATSRSGLWNDQRPYAPAAARGIGPARVPGRFVRVGQLRIGPFVWERPLVQLTVPGSPHGAYAGDGLIGLRAIRRLNLSVDTRNRVLWGAANGLDFPPNDYGMSGLWIEPARGGLEIVDVGTGSPAAKAGMRKGDLILGETAEPFIRRITGPAGTRIAFDYHRAGAKARAEFVLEDFL
jgi:serine protease Do